MNKRKNTKYSRVLESHFGSGKIDPVDISRATSATINTLRDAFRLQQSLSREELIRLYMSILKELV